jgi:hypothetical protein
LAAKENRSGINKTQTANFIKELAVLIAI